MQLTRTTSDTRPESFHVREDSIRLVERATTTTPSLQSRVELWEPFVYPSLEALEKKQQNDRTSLGIIQPERLQFGYELLERTTDEDRKLTCILAKQASLLEDPLNPLKPPKYSFFYQYASGGKRHKHTIQDWEAQAAYYKFCHRYGNEQAALEKMEERYAQDIPKRNPHFIMGNMHKRPWQFILIGILRPGDRLQRVQKQPRLL